jgi:hypothetical protein
VGCVGEGIVGCIIVGVSERELWGGVANWIIRREARMLK